MCAFLHIFTINFSAAGKGDRRGTYRILMGRLKRKGSLERREPRWYDNIKMDFQGVG
jgi:hypothetical protein